MNPASTRVAPGPNWLRVIASLFQKMLLNSAVGLEKPGDPAGRGWESPGARGGGGPGTGGASPPGRRRAGCGTPMGEFSDGAVLTLLPTELLMIRALAASSSVMPPPRSAAPLSTTMLLRMLTGSVNESAPEMPPPSSPEKVPRVRFGSGFPAPEGLRRRAGTRAAGHGQS